MKKLVRYDLERRRTKLLEQLEEARVLWRNIKKRTGVVAGYIQQNLPFQVCTTATRVSNCTVHSAVF